MSGIGLDRNVRFEHLGVLNKFGKDLHEEPRVDTDHEPKRTRTPESAVPT